MVLPTCDLTRDQPIEFRVSNLTVVNLVIMLIPKCLTKKIRPTMESDDKSALLTGVRDDYDSP